MVDLLQITTSPPIYDKKEVFPHERTFSELVARIQDEIDDTTDEYLQQVQKCIFSAIRYCERESFYFNETRDVIFTTEVGRGRYGMNDDINIATAAQIKNVYVESSDIKQLLSRISPNDMEISMKGMSNGMPHSYSYFDRYLYLTPVPDSSYNIRLILSAIRVDDIGQVDELNVWFTEAFDLIKCRSKYELYLHYLKDREAANDCRIEFEDQLRIMRNETSKRSYCDRIVSTEF